MAPKICAFASMVLAICGLIGTSSGHLIMNAPVPFGVDTLNNSPLEDAAPGSSGSDFPCKQRPGVYDITAMNNMAVGDTQLLNFTGSASHGGGTCQIAVTMDLEPSVHSVWKLIQVFEGGCPISANGNDGTHPFTFTIPKDFPNGRSTLSWSWYNRIGNREIYQNCAPIDVTGGSDSKQLYDSLPEWYIINLPTSDCSTVEETDQIIPNPGQYIIKNTGEGNKLGGATGPKCAASAASQTSGVTGYQTAVISDGAAYSAPAKNGDVTGKATPQAAAPTGGSSGSSPASVSVPATTSASAPASVATQAPASSAAESSSFPTMSVSSAAGVSGPATTTGSGTAPVGTGTSGGSGTSGGTGTCGTSGAILCNGPHQFGICNNGQVVWQAVAAGTACSNGKITKRSDLRRAHIRRKVQIGDDDLGDI